MSIQTCIHSLECSTYLNITHPEPLGGAVHMNLADDFLYEGWKVALVITCGQFVSADVMWFSICYKARGDNILLWLTVIISVIADPVPS